MITSREKAKAKKAVNEVLHTIGTTYHASLPIGDIDTVLTANGFDAMEEGIYCGLEGRINEPVGNNVYLTMSWYKMESGRYEVTAYVS